MKSFNLNGNSHFEEAGFNRALALNSANFLCEQWREGCFRYLPVMEKDSIWRYSRLPSTNDPAQGWKLHISATILTANRVFARVAPFLQSYRALFKAPAVVAQ